MTERIFRSIMAVAGSVLLVSLVVVMGYLYAYFGGVQERQLRAELELAARGVELSGRAYLDALGAGGNRLTWIAADGAVRYDARADEHGMENHAQREEVQAAFRDGEGRSSRYSRTLMEKTRYCARRLSDGSVLRISVSHATVGRLFFGMLQTLCVIGFATLILAFCLAWRLSRRFASCAVVDSTDQNEQASSNPQTLVSHQDDEDESSLSC